jgi:hypothetical protein
MVTPVLPEVNDEDHGDRQLLRTSSFLSFSVAS